jgi:hypothetical protein
VAVVGIAIAVVVGSATARAAELRLHAADSCVDAAQIEEQVAQHGLHAPARRARRLPARHRPARRYAMTEVEAEETLLLARARRALAPSPEAVGRLRASVRAALAAPTPDVPAAARLSSWSSRLLVATAIAGASGGIGYWAGHRAGARQQPPLAAPAVTLPPTPAPPASVAPMVVAPAAAEPSLPTEGTSRPTRLRPQRPRDVLPPSATPASLAKEVEALRAVERALRDGRPGLALALLKELDRTVPAGRLVEEREATATIARCASGATPLGVDLAADFSSSYPSSVYRARVEQACAKADPDD